MRKVSAKKHLCLSLLITPLLFFSGCLEESKGEEAATPQTAKAAGESTAKTVQDGSEVLLKINGVPKITLNMLNEEFDRLLDENPQLKQVLPFMPDAKANFLQGMVNQAVVSHWASVNNIHESKQFREEKARTDDQVEKMLDTKYFSEKHPVTVSDAEVKAFYEENKNKPEFMVSQGGVKAEGVSFTSEEAAKAFEATAKGTKQELSKVAADAGHAEDYRDFKTVNNQSIGIDPSLRTAIVSLNRFPTVEVVKVGDVWWVIKAYSKEEPQYRPLEQIKPNLEEYLKKQKQMEVFEKAIDGYKKEYKVEINDAPVKSKIDEKELQHLQEMMFEQAGEEAAANEEAHQPVHTMRTV